MASVRHHHYSRPAARRAATAGLTRLRRWERLAERHWALASYALLSLVVAAYTIGQLTQL